MPDRPRHPKNILVMRYRFIGDTLLTVPFLRNLRKAYPEAAIDVLVAPNSGEVLRHCPYVNQLMFFDTTRKHRYESRTGQKPRTFWYYVQKLQKRKYDAAFVLKRSFSSALLAFLAGIPVRVGFDTEWRRLLLTRAIPYRRDAHESECFLDVLRAVDIPVDDNRLEAWWSRKETEKMEEMWKRVEKTPLHVLIHKTASNPEKEWPEEIFTGISRWLIKEHGATLHCMGAASDVGSYESIAAALPSGDRTHFYNWCGQTSLTESLALLGRMTFVIGVDSGTLHMASAVGVPSVGLFSPEKVQKWAPLGDNNSIVTEKSLEKVRAACQRFLNISAGKA